VTKLVRFDEELWVRIDLDQKKIAEKAHRLLAECKLAIEKDSQWQDRLSPLMQYAQMGLEGRLTRPRSWADEPLRYEFGERLLPENVREAYSEFAFQTHGLTSDIPEIIHRDGQSYIAVDE
jgi:hypothetical protein